MYEGTLRKLLNAFNSAMNGPQGAGNSGNPVHQPNEIRAVELAAQRVQLRHVAFLGGLELLLERGEIVDRGQELSRAGSSGNGASPQAHFELRRSGKPVNPVKYLSRL